MNPRKTSLAALLALVMVPVTLPGADPEPTVQKIRFVEDDAQNRMASKIYVLKHQKANDLVPFLLGAIKRYAKNGSADRINYKAGKQQLIAVNCPAPLLPYIDDMIAKLDHPCAAGPDGSGIDGTGIVRNVYLPQYRTGETLVNIMVKAGIPSNATEGANQDAAVALDAATGMIYWKDSVNKSKDMQKYLAWLDRPVPQCVVSMRVYELRESDLLDLGLDYLAWKNGPGLNLLEAGATCLNNSAMSKVFGPYGFFMFAPEFDLSFLRLLQQNGKAKIAASANLTLVTGQNADLSFTPNYQNLTKDKDFKSAVAVSGNDTMTMKITAPVISVPPSERAEAAAGQTGVVQFAYDLRIRNVVERSNSGDELYDEFTSSSSISLKSGGAKILSRWTREQEVEQSIGIPFLCELPVLKYLFGTTTRTREKHLYFLTVETELAHPDTALSAIAGKLVAIPELVKQTTTGEKNIMNLKHILAGVLSLAPLTAAFANQQPTANSNPAYAPTSFQPQLRFNIKEGTDTVHFIRDTNDPKIVTKVYLLKHTDPYSIRPYLREMVQTLRVDYNNPAGRSNPDYYNVYSKDNAAGTQKIFVPAGIECIRFADGTGALIVSAEDYRFRDNAQGMGIDALVAGLDRPGLVNSSGQPKFIYFPKNRSAKELQTLVKLVGANVSNDTAELIGGKDKIEYDAELNCLFFNTALYSRKNIEQMLKIYDIPYPEVRVRCTVYEIQSENDGMLGLDFQSWKNNDGVRLLQTGARYSRNMNVRDVLGAVAPNGTINTEYFNMEPKWNTRFLDFLVSKGRASVVTTGELSIRHNATGKLTQTGGTMYAALTKIPSTAKNGTGEHGQAVEVKSANSKFKFELELTPSVTAGATTLAVKVGTRSMLGIDSTGAVRVSEYRNSQKVMLSNGKTRFYLGGIDKSETVSVSGGLPLLKDLPLLGWLFSTERESVKKSQIIVVADCELVRPDSAPDAEAQKAIQSIRDPGGETSVFTPFGYRQWGLDSER